VCGIQILASAGSFVVVGGQCFRLRAPHDGWWTVDTNAAARTTVYLEQEEKHRLGLMMRLPPGHGAGSAAEAIVRLLEANQNSH
jgi:hypothetical protein